jgi:hypothetical protein
MKRALIFLAVFLSLPVVASAQSSGDPCPASPVYENHNMADYGPLKVKVVEGRAIVHTEDKSVPETAISGACLSLFTEKEHTLVASAVADSEGRFQFGHVAAGHYRLLARSNGFCTANIPVLIMGSSPAAKSQATELLIHFRPAGIDTCSYGELVARLKNKRSAAQPVIDPATENSHIELPVTATPTTH